MRCFQIPLRSYRCKKIFTRKKFKLRANELLKQSSKPIRQIAKELGIGENNLYNWRKQFHLKQDKAFPNQPQLDEKELELYVV
ncbi:transposase [Legionella drozanskii]|uniref:transposase n=1 Tax=Legionella drozanskii TaxID=96228 RepID=UPI001040F868|nr:transposase [Legionella drozanskii]